MPFLVVRGDGSRPNKGNDPGDPYSKWWEEFLPELKKENGDLRSWNTSSFRLAREVKLFRDMIMPRICKQTGDQLGVLLIDRTILSRTMIPRELKEINNPSDLYPTPDGRHFMTVEEVCPDLIFNLIADKEVLISRLSEDDKKYDFRKQNIELKSDWYKDAVKFIPEELRSRVIDIDANKTIEEVQNDIQNVIIEKIPELIIINKERLKNESNI